MAAASTGRKFLSALARTLDETLFAPSPATRPSRSPAPPSPPASPPTPSGSSAQRRRLARRGATHPLLPPEVQREAAHAPRHAAARLGSGPGHHHPPASPPRRKSTSATQSKSKRRSPPLAPHRPACRPAATPARGADRPPAAPRSPSPSKTSAAFPYPPGKVGGAAVLTAQSQCPFKAFATARLAAQSWEPAEAGLTPSQRGNSAPRRPPLHLGRPAARHSHPRRTHEPDRPKVLGRQPRPQSSNKTSRPAFATACPPLPRTRSSSASPPGHRVAGLRIHPHPFEVSKPKLAAPSPRRPHFQPPPRPHRPPQRRLRAGHRLQIRRCLAQILGPAPPRRRATPPLRRLRPRPTIKLGGLVFAKVRPGDHASPAASATPAATLFAGLRAGSTLMKKRLNRRAARSTGGKHRAARQRLPRRPRRSRPARSPKTCERCGLQTLCRIQENRIAPKDEDESEDAEAADE
jgi:ATP-dependent helicase/nuclease subunit B